MKNSTSLPLLFRDALVTLEFVRITGLLLHEEHGHTRLFLPSPKNAGLWGKSGECLVICTNDQEVWIRKYSKDVTDSPIFEQVIKPNLNAKSDDGLVKAMIDFDQQNVKTSDLLSRQANPDWERLG